MKLRFSLAAALLLCLPLLSFSHEVSNADETAIRQVVQYYFDGWKNHDPESLKKALHPKGEWLITSDMNDLTWVPHTRVYANIKETARRRVPQFKVISRIVSIDVTDRAACVKVEFDYPDAYLGSAKADMRKTPPGVRQTEYLSLIKFTEGWKIVSKVSSDEQLPAAPAEGQSATR